MITFPDLDDLMIARVRKALSAEISNAQKGEQILFALFWWRGACAARAFVSKNGSIVRGGLFAGMLWPQRTMPGKVLPTLLGSFEKALQPEIAALDGRQYKRVINIGCGVGEYAVGLARRWPNAAVFAHDISDEALAWAREIAEMNGVKGRITFGGQIDHAGLNDLLDERTLVFCDIEGAEEQLLDPVLVPKLRDADVIVELHEAYDSNLRDRFLRQFAHTHDLVLVTDWQSDLTNDPYFLDQPDIDRVVATCELRDGPTPWAVLRAKHWA